LQSKLRVYKIKHKYIHNEIASLHASKYFQLLANSKVKEIFRKVFTETSKRKKEKWGQDDIIPVLSEKLYNYQRSQIGIPLPSVSTLHRWISKLPFSPRLLTQVFSLMEQA